MNTLAIAMGGHCRVGLEDNIYHGFDRSELATNQGLVERVADITESFGRRLADPVRARALLGLGRRRRAPRGRRRPAAEGDRMTGGRPEIGPALSAAWRHGRAARAELRAWQDARLRRLVRARLRVGALLPQALRPATTAPAPHPGHGRSRPDPLQRQGRDAAGRARPRCWRKATIPPRCSACAPAARRASPSPSAAPGWRTSSSTCSGSAPSARSACGTATGSSRSASAGGPRTATRSWSAARCDAVGLHRKQLIDGLQEPAEVGGQLREARHPRCWWVCPGCSTACTAPELATWCARCVPGW